MVFRKSKDTPSDLASLGHLPLWGRQVFDSLERTGGCRGVFHIRSFVRWKTYGLPVDKVVDNVDNC